METVSATMMTFGIVLLLASWIQLLFVSFKDDFSWGLSTLFVPPLSYVYGLFTLEKSGAALFMAVLGWILVFFAIS